MSLRTILKDLGATMVALRITSKRGEEIIPYKFDPQTNEFTKVDKRAIPPDTSLRALEIIFSTDDISNSKDEKGMPTSSILHDLEPEVCNMLATISTQPTEADSFDPVNRPLHYNEGKIERIDAIESACTGLTGFEGLCTGTAIKYIWRWKKKEKPDQDIRKAIWYLKRLLKHLEEKEEEE